MSTEQNEPEKKPEVRTRTRPNSEASQPSPEAPQPNTVTMDLSGITPFDNEVRFRLAFPISLAGAKVNELVLRRPKLRDRLKSSREHQNGDVQMAATIAQATNISLDEIEQMDLSDYGRLEAIMAVFLSARPKA